MTRSGAAISINLPRAARRSPNRTCGVLLERLDVGTDGSLILLGVEGSHFLWRMVRRLVGVLAAVGRGDLAVDAATSLLEERSDLPGQLTAPASGLFLERVFYKGDSREVPLKPATRVD